MVRMSQFLLVLNLFMQSLILSQVQGLQILPTHYNFSTLAIMSVNGSSITGECVNVSNPNLDGTTTCYDPASSVLFDGHIPTLTGLDGSTWADQLVVLGYPAYGRSSFQINSQIPLATVGRIEITLFNCPQWQLGSSFIHVYFYTSSGRLLNILFVDRLTVFSCDSLVTVCIPTTSSIVARRVEIIFGVTHSHLLIAEIGIFGSSSPCPSYTITPGNWTAPNVTTSGNEITTSTTGNSPLGKPSEGLLQKEFRPFISVLSLCAAVQVVVVFTVGVVMVCRYHTGKRVCPREEQLVQHQEPLEDQEVYELVDEHPKKLPRPPTHKKSVYTKNVAYA